MKRSITFVLSITKKSYFTSFVVFLKMLGLRVLGKLLAPSPHTCACWTVKHYLHCFCNFGLRNRLTKSPQALQILNSFVTNWSFMNISSKPSPSKTVRKRLCKTEPPCESHSVELIFAQWFEKVLGLRLVCGQSQDKPLAWSLTQLGYVFYLFVRILLVPK